MSVHFRPFSITDHAEARRLWESTEGVGLSEADSEQNMRRFLERNPELSLAAVDGGSLIGTLLCGHDGRRGLIHHLVVASTHRRQGVARELLRRALDGLRNAGIAKCHLLVFRDNAAGRAFWQSVGAEERHTLVLFSASTG